MKNIHTDEELIKKKYLIERGYREASGWAVNTEELNPEGFAEIFWEGRHLEDAISDYCRRVESYWVLDANAEVVFEDIDEAVDDAEENSNVSFEDFKKNK